MNIFFIRLKSYIFTLRSKEREGLSIPSCTMVSHAQDREISQKGGEWYTRSFRALLKNSKKVKINILNFLIIVIGILYRLRMILQIMGIFINVFGIARLLDIKNIKSKASQRDSLLPKKDTVILKIKQHIIEIQPVIKSNRTTKYNKLTNNKYLKVDIEIKNKQKFETPVSLKSTQ